VCSVSPNNIHYTYICLHISRSCEYALCRLLCTEPSLDIADIFKTKFSDVTNTPECGPHSLIGEADKCYKLKENLHVGGTNLIFFNKKVTAPWWLSQNT
jgi:hypothetical protein